jgi:iron complex transport system substrate-binding protein
MRVVSLLPAATEMVAALGFEHQLVGVTHECDWPPTVASLPRVTSTPVDVHASAADVDAQVRSLSGSGAPLFTLDGAAIEALEPDLILTQALCDVCAVHEDDVRAIADSLPGPPAVVTLDGTTLDGVFADLRAVATALGVEERGTVLAEWMRGRMKAVHETLRAERAPRPRVAVVEWTDPLFIAGHWVPDMIRRAGGSDALAEPGAHSKVRNMAELAAADPDILLFAPCGHDVARAAAEARRVLATPAWAWATECAIWAVDANALTSRPGPRVVEGIETFAAIFNPPLFPPVAESRAIELTRLGVLG